MNGHPERNDEPRAVRAHDDGQLGGVERGFGGVREDGVCDGEHGRRCGRAVREEQR